MFHLSNFRISVGLARVVCVSDECDCFLFQCRSRIWTLLLFVEARPISLSIYTKSENSLTSFSPYTTFLVILSWFALFFFFGRGESTQTEEMDRGDLYFIRYKIVKGAIESGKMDLI